MFKNIIDGPGDNELIFFRFPILLTICSLGRLYQFTLLVELYGNMSFYFFLCMLTKISEQKRKNLAPFLKLIHEIEVANL